MDDRSFCRGSRPGGATTVLLACGVFLLVLISRHSIAAFNDRPAAGQTIQRTMLTSTGERITPLDESRSASRVHSQVVSALTQNNDAGADPTTRRLPRRAEREAASGEGPICSLNSLPEYRLGPGDVVEVIYQLTRQKRPEPYQIDISDELEIIFPYTPQFNSKPAVRSDGKIDMPLIGEFEVAGKTTTQVDDELTSQYSTVLKRPEVQVRVLKSNAAIEELKRAITTSPRGQSRLEPVRPDGFISLPLVGDVLAAGLRVPEVSQSIIDKYRAVGVMDIDITVVLLEVRAPVAYVTGGVMSPGPVVLQGPTDVWRLVATAGGFTQDADPRHVIVVQCAGDHEKRVVLNHEEWLSSLNGSQNALIGRGDIVYVPKGTNMFVYVSGEVARPGPIPLQQGQALTVTQAIAAAGGVTDPGNECQVLLLRKKWFGRPCVEAVPYRQLFEPGQSCNGGSCPLPDTVLNPGDVLYVPRSPVGDFNKFARDYFKNGIWTILPFNFSAGYRLDHKD